MRGTSRHPYSAHKAAVEAELTRPRRIGHRGLRLPSLHRRRAGSDAVARPRSRCSRWASGSPARCAGRWARCPSCGRCCPTPACPSSSSITTTSPPPLRGGRRPRRARRLQPRRARRADDHRSRPRPGLARVPAPQLAVGAAAEAVALMPFLPDEAAWIEAVRRPVLMDTARARRKLHWMPHHDARATLRQTIEAVRSG